MTKSTNGEPATAQPVEQKGPQAGSDDQPLHPNSNTSRDRIMARVAESKARIDAMSPEERRGKNTSNQNLQACNSPKTPN
jgi:hypothetical protein